MGASDLGAHTYVEFGLLSVINRFFDYYSLIIGRAWKETLDLFDVRKVQTWLTLAGVIIGFFLLWLILGPMPAFDEIQTWAITILAPTIGLFALVFLAQFAFAPVRIDHERRIRNDILQQRNAELLERLQPRITIVFRSGPPFEQPSSILDSNGHQLPGCRRLYRVGVKCESPTTGVSDVSVELAAIEPDIIPFLPIRLHQMHDNPSGDEPYRQSFDLNPGETKHIDVVYIIEGNTSIPHHDHFILSYAQRNVANTIPAQRVELTILAHARDCPPIQRQFEIRPDTERGYRFDSL